MAGRNRVPLEFSSCLCFARAPVCYLCMAAADNDTVAFTCTHTHTHSRIYNMYKTEFARIARESIVFSWHPPTRLHKHTLQHTTLYTSCHESVHLPGARCGRGGGVLPFSIYTVHTHTRRHKTDTIRQRGPMTSPPLSTTPPSYARTNPLLHSLAPPPVLLPSDPCVNSK